MNETHATLLCSGPSARNHAIPDQPLCCVNGAVKIALEAGQRIDAWVMVEVAAGNTYGKWTDAVMASSPDCQIIVSHDTLKSRWPIDHPGVPHRIYDELTGDPEQHYMTSRKAPLPRTSGTCALYAMQALWSPASITIIGMDGYKPSKTLYAEGCGEAANPCPNAVLEAHRSNEYWYDRLCNDPLFANTTITRLT